MSDRKHLEHRAKAIRMRCDPWMERFRPCHEYAVNVRGWGGLSDVE